MPVFEHGRRGDAGDEVISTRVLTVPNLISLIRFAALPLLYLDIVNGNAGRAFLILISVALSDWIDGYIARRFDQVSRVGQLADPITDRLLVVVVGVGFLVGDVLPLWAVAALLARDAVLLGVGGLVLLTYELSPPGVTDLGKAATFGLLLALPMFLLADYLDAANLHDGAWLMLITSGVLYWVAAFQYVTITIGEIASRRRDGPDQSDSDGSRGGVDRATAG